MIIKEIAQELKRVVTGKTVDAMIPPFLYIIANTFLELRMAVLLSLTASVALVLLRLAQKKSWKYAFSGFLGMLIAACFALIADNAANYYTPKLLSSLGLMALSLISLLAKKPLVAWLSHLSRGWELSWFWRSDIRPAYTEVTFFWFLLFTARALLQFFLLTSENIAGLFILNTLLGLPVTLTILILSYIYGMWRLKHLGGPSIEEHRNGLPKPWKGQSRGF